MQDINASFFITKMSKSGKKTIFDFLKISQNPHFPGNSGAKPILTRILINSQILEINRKNLTEYH